jgi:hypothetical protein
MQTEALNCPNCGAAVASDRTQCEFCKSRLKTVGCPSCLGLMFLGSKFCGHCGAAAAEAELIEEKRSRRLSSLRSRASAFKDRYGEVCANANGAADSGRASRHSNICVTTRSSSQAVLTLHRRSGSRTQRRDAGQLRSMP